MSKIKITLDTKQLLGFNQLTTVSKEFEVPSDRLEDLRRLANKIGEIDQINEDISKVLNKVSETVVPPGEMLKLSNKISEVGAPRGKI